MSAQEGRKLLAAATKRPGWAHSEAAPLIVFLVNRADALLDLWEAGEGHECPGTDERVGEVAVPGVACPICAALSRLEES